MSVEVSVRVDGGFMREVEAAADVFLCFCPWNESRMLCWKRQYEVL